MLTETLQSNQYLWHLLADIFHVERAKSVIENSFLLLFYVLADWLPLDLPVEFVEAEPELYLLGKQSFDI